MSVQLEWKKDDRLFHDGQERLWLGAMPVAGVFWKSGARGDEDSGGPRCVIELPGIAARDLPHKSFDAAKAQAVTLVMRWVLKAGLQPKEQS